MTNLQRAIQPDPEVEALQQIIAAIQGLDEDRRQSIVNTALVFCRGRKSPSMVKPPDEPKEK